MFYCFYFQVIKNNHIRFKIIKHGENYGFYNLISLFFFNNYTFKKQKN